MRTPTALVIVLMGLLLHACGGSTIESAPSSVAPAGTRSAATTVPSETTSPSVTEPAEASANTEIPEDGETDGVTQEEDLLNPTLAPGTPTLETTSEGIVIRWLGTGPDIASYLVYRRSAPGNQWTILGEVSPEGDNLGGYSFVIADVSEQTGEFAVVAVDLDGNRSQFSESVAIDE